MIFLRIILLFWEKCVILCSIKWIEIWACPRKEDDMKDISRNLTMLCDFYELTMSNGYFESGMKDKIVYFDVFYRNNPDNGGFAVVAGLEQVVEYINQLHFDAEDIEYLRSKNCFSDAFLEFLRDSSSISSKLISSFLISDMVSITSLITLSGVEAPAETPTVIFFFNFSRGSSCAFLI